MTQAKILIVDDLNDNLIALEATLAPLGYPVCKAKSGPEALKRLLEDDFAVIMIDVQMPGMDGFETVSLIKEREKSKYIPVIFITALSTEDQNIIYGYSAGAVDYIFKPYHPDILKAKVKVFIELFERGEQIKAQGEKLREIEKREAEIKRFDAIREIEQKHFAEMVKWQRIFMRQMLASITEGRLLLCDSDKDLPNPLPVLVDEISLEPYGAIRTLRTSAEQSAKRAGLPDIRWQDLISAVSEAAMNAVVHADGGTSRIYIHPSGVVQVWIEDRGKGIAFENIHRATLERGYTTAGTMGHGFWMMLETVDRVFLLTGPDGTTVVLEQECSRPLPPWLQE